MLAADRARKREDLLQATEKLLEPIIARTQAGLADAGPIGVGLRWVRKVIGKHKTSKHFAVTITDASLDVARKQDQIDAEAALVHVLRTPIPASHLDGSAIRHPANPAKHQVKP